ncbi:dTDP-4-dehydrorhamnose reductase [Veillonella sp.]|uniref:dTDP-4-dehydrorhamnose reductase n=1 Tax=Veillonella sp. TaxID=1926307 RepID=UPI0025DAEA63|nr:dTDP-4-dehydrorhamnose reductase [Veillonella sp.]
MKVLVTGAAGQLGYDVVRELLNQKHYVIASGLSILPCDVHEYYIAQSELEYIPLDLTNKEMVQKVIREYHPEAVIHCAAWTAVDAAEEERNRAAVYAINVEATKNLANACKSIDAICIYVSTDYVFNGQGNKPWKADGETYAPLNVYGQSKLEGELAIRNMLEKYFIVRISWVFGSHGNNFIKTMLRIGKNHKTIRVVNDQIGLPTYTVDLAKLLVAMINSQQYGTYHVTNEGLYISWYDFACEIFKQANYTTKVEPVSTEEYGLSKAKRPFNSRLDRSKLLQKGFFLLPNWKEALRRFLEEVRES